MEISRQRKWQIKQVANRCCQMCGKAAWLDRTYCKEHMQLRRNAARLLLGLPLTQPVRKYTKRKKIK